MGSPSTNSDVRQHDTLPAPDHGPAIPLAQPGDQIGAYRVVADIGRGGMGMVCKAIHDELQRPVAIKIMLPHIAEQPELVERFMREGRLAASLAHPNLVTVHDCARWRGLPYLVLEYIDGGDIADLVMERGPLPEDQALRIITQAAKGLQALEGAGLVHRDIKPANIFLTSDGRIKLGDMGLARRLTDTDDLTVTGQAIGTPAYMAPEQVLGQKDIDSRLDIYALGATLYSLLTGKRPFDGTTPFAVVDRILNGPQPDLQELRAGLHQQTRALIARAMARERDHRYADCAAFLDALRVCREAVEGTAGPSRRPPLRLLVGITAALLAIVLLVVLPGGEEPPPTTAATAVDDHRPSASAVATQATERSPAISGALPQGPAPTQRIQVIGNSYAQGVGADYQPAIRLLDGRFSHLDPAGLQAHGLPGETAAGILASIRNDALPAAAYRGVVVLWAARNHLSEAPEATRRAIGAMIAEVERRGCQHWLITSCPLLPNEVDAQGQPNASGQEVVAFNRWLAQTVGPGRIIDATTLVIDHPLASDSLHPNTDGYRIWTQRLATRLLDLGWISTELPTTRSRRALATGHADDVLVLQPTPGARQTLPADPASEHTAIIWYKGQGSGFLFGPNQVGDARGRWGLRLFNGHLWLGLGDRHASIVSPVADDAWHMLGWLVRDGRGQLIHNGRLVGEAIAPGAHLAGQPWCIGGADPTQSGRWSAAGRYANAAIWRSALSEADLATIYDQGKGLPPAALPAADALVALLPLDQHRGRYHGGWPDLLGNAEASGVQLGAANLVDDAPGR